MTSKSGVFHFSIQHQKSFSLSSKSSVTKSNVVWYLVRNSFFHIIFTLIHQVLNEIIPNTVEVIA